MADNTRELSQRERDLFSGRDSGGSGDTTADDGPDFDPRPPSRVDRSPDDDRDQSTPGSRTGGSSGGGGGGGGGGSSRSRTETVRASASVTNLSQRQEDLLRGTGPTLAPDETSPSRRSDVESVQARALDFGGSIRDRIGGAADTAADVAAPIGSGARRVESGIDRALGDGRSVGGLLGSAARASSRDVDESTLRRAEQFTGPLDDAGQRFRSRAEDVGDDMSGAQLPIGPAGATGGSVGGRAGNLFVGAVGDTVAAGLGAPQTTVDAIRAGQRVEDELLETLETDGVVEATSEAGSRAASGASTVASAAARQAVEEPTRTTGALLGGTVAGTAAVRGARGAGSALRRSDVDTGGASNIRQPMSTDGGSLARQFGRLQRELDDFLDDTRGQQQLIQRGRTRQRSGGDDELGPPRPRTDEVRDSAGIRRDRARSGFGQGRDGRLGRGRGDPDGFRDATFARDPSEPPEPDFSGLASATRRFDGEFETPRDPLDTRGGGFGAVETGATVGGLLGGQAAASDAVGLLDEASSSSIEREILGDLDGTGTDTGIDTGTDTEMGTDTDPFVGTDEDVAGLTRFQARSAVAPRSATDTVVDSLTGFDTASPVADPTPADPTRSGRGVTRPPQSPGRRRVPTLDVEFDDGREKLEADFAAADALIRNPTQSLDDVSDDLRTLDRITEGFDAP